MMESKIFSSDLLKKVEASGIIAVLEIEDAGNAIPVVDALLEGGISAIPYMGNIHHCLIYAPTVERRDVMENADSVATR